MTDKSEKPKLTAKASEITEPIKIGSTTIHPSGRLADPKLRGPLSFVVVGRGGKPSIKKPKDE